MEQGPGRFRDSRVSSQMMFSVFVQFFFFCKNADQVPHAGCIEKSDFLARAEAWNLGG